MAQLLNSVFMELANELPALIPRHKVAELLGGVISAGYLANLDCEKKGPRRVRIGNKICYPRKSLLEWLQSRTEIV